MKKYQVITLVLLLIFVLGLANDSDNDMSDVTLQVHQAFWHEDGETINVENLEELSIDQIEVVQNGFSKTFSLYEFEDYFNERFSNGYNIYSYSRTTTELFGFWGTSNSEFGVGEEIKGELQINAWRIFTDWKVSKIKITFENQDESAG